jgi:hypothetical protein
MDFGWKLPEKGNDASAEAELFEVFGVQKDHDAKPREVIFVTRTIYST